MHTPHDQMNPRNLRAKYESWVGKKVTVGLTTFHYVSGIWKAIEGYDAIFTIGGRELHVRLAEIDTIAEALGAQAEYFK